jgi:2-oxoglutarate ferredoxin oxidoreductase subunit gamma
MWKNRSTRRNTSGSVTKRRPNQKKSIAPAGEGWRYEVRFSGSGGQGILLAAVVLAEACGVHDGRHVSQTESYGPESRGGYSRADVVISDRPIDYPMTMKPDLLLAMNQAGCDAFFPEMDPAGLLVVDATWVHEVPTSRAVAIPFTEIARKKTGGEMAANMVALGAVIHLTRIVSLNKLKSALAARVPEHTLDMNRASLEAGVKAAKGVDLSALPTAVGPDEEEV